MQAAGLEHLLYIVEGRVEGLGEGAFVSGGGGGGGGGGVGGGGVGWGGLIFSSTFAFLTSSNLETRDSPGQQRPNPTPHPHRHARTAGSAYLRNGDCGTGRLQGARGG